MLLPGLDGTGLLSKPAVRACPDEFEAVVQALPTQESLDYQELSHRVAAALPTDEPFLLVGESFSGPLALELAARRPAGLVGVVLVATFVTPPKPRWIRLLPWSVIFRFPPPGVIIRRYLVGRRGTAELFDLLHRIPELVAPEVMALRVRLATSVDARVALRSCPVPILYLQASQDRLVPKGALDQILRVRPEVEHRKIESPHFVLQIAPEEAWGQIQSFVQRLRRDIIGVGGRGA